MKSNRLSKFLLQPYPFYYEGKFLIAIIGIIYLMTFCFNYFFKPFNVNITEHKLDFFWISNIHALASIVVFSVLIFVVKLNHKIDENWTILSETLLISTLLLLIGIGQFLVRDIIYDNPNNWSLAYFIEEIRNTFLIGILFTLIIIPLNFNRLYYKNIKSADLLNIKSQNKPIAINTSSILIKTQVKSETFNMPLSDFLFARAEGNYVEIYLDRNNKNVKLLKRISIKDLNSRLHPFPFIIKTHRAYLVNLQKISNVKGNASGYKIILNNHPHPVPVSRKMIPFFEKKMRDFEL